VERIEGLEQQHRDLMAGFRTHYAERAPRKLEEEQDRYFAKLKTAERREADEMPEEVLLRFPGFVNYRKPVS
jgi:hypothetical protein